MHTNDNNNQNVNSNESTNITNNNNAIANNANNEQTNIYKNQYDHHMHLLQSQFTQEIQKLDVKESITANVTQSDPMEELIFQDDVDDEPSEDVFYSLHHPYRKHDPTAPVNNDYMMFLECKTYNAIFDFKEAEASIIIANPKAICTTITNIMQNLILYGNIGSASLIIDNAKQDLHIDIYKYITDNVKTLFPVPEYFKRLQATTVNHLKSNYNTPTNTNNSTPASNVSNNQIRINELNQYIIKPYFFLNTMTVAVPIIPRIDLRIVRNLYDKIKQTFLLDCTDTTRYLSYKIETHYLFRQQLISFAHEIINEYIRYNWNILTLDVLNKCRNNIKLNESEQYIYNNLNNPPTIDFNTIFNQLIEIYTKHLKEFLLICMKLQLLIYIIHNNPIKPRGKDNRRVWPKEMYHNIPFPLPNTFFHNHVNNNEKCYDELIYNDNIYPMLNMIYATQSVILVTDYHRMITKYNETIKLQIQIFEIAIQALPIDLKSQIKYEYLPNGCMETIQLHYHMIIYLSAHRCYVETCNELTQPPIHSIKESIIITEDNTERAIDINEYAKDILSYTDKILIDMNKEQIVLPVVDNVNINIKLTPYGKRILDKKLRECKLRNKSFVKNVTKTSVPIISTTLTESKEDIFKNLANNKGFIKPADLMKLYQQCKPNNVIKDTTSIMTNTNTINNNLNNNNNINPNNSNRNNNTTDNRV